MGLTSNAHWLLYVQQVCSLIRPQSPISLWPGAAAQTSHHPHTLSQWYSRMALLLAWVSLPSAAQPLKPKNNRFMNTISCAFFVSLPETNYTKPSKYCTRKLECNYCKASFNKARTNVSSSYHNYSTEGSPLCHNNEQTPYRRILLTPFTLLMIFFCFKEELNVSGTVVNRCIIAARYPEVTQK